MNGSFRRNMGSFGEAIVKKHLVTQGFRHVESNYLKRFGEIDLILLKGEVLHFFEVKTVSRETSGKGVIHETSGHRPEENVSRYKLKKIGKVIQIYLSERNIFENFDWQFNIACVFLDHQKKRSYIGFLWDIPVPE